MFPRLIALTLAVLLVLLGPGAAVSAEPSIPEPPDLQARAAVLIEASTGAVLYEKRPHDRLPPASLTKMVTALVALERGGLEQSILATERTLVEPSIIGMEPGDRLPLRQALYGLLLNSGNDVALAIAETLGQGSIDRFVGWMNKFVVSLGLSNTRFANPHGLDIGEHYSSAYDMAVIGRVLLRQTLLREMVGDQRHDYTGPPLWAFRSTNRLLETYPGADGIKTGYETRAGRCLAASATRDGRQLIAVVLNSEHYLADSAALLDYGFSLPPAVTPIHTPPSTAEHPVWFGAQPPALSMRELIRPRRASWPAESAAGARSAPASNQPSAFELLRGATVNSRG